MRTLSVVLCAAVLSAPAPAPAVVQRLVSLKDVIAQEQMIFVATVDSVAPEKPAVVLVVGELLKGEKLPFEKLNVSLSGDAEAQKDKHSEVLLARLERGRKLVVFVSRDKGRFFACCFLEGTWFQIRGVEDEGTKSVRWSLLHCEPYLRRTFKGTTAELVKVVEGGLAKSVVPPAPEKDEPPGYGPVLEKAAPKK